MPSIRKTTEIHNPSDILARASRPQYSSNHLPRHRDWRHTTSVFRHDDEDDPSYRGRESTVWDELDWDAQIGVFGKEKRSYAMKKVTWDQSVEDREEKQEVAFTEIEDRPEEQEVPLPEDEGGLGERGWVMMGLDGVMETGTPETVDAPARLVKIEDVGGVLDTSKMAGKVAPRKILKSAVQARRSHRRPCSRADVVAGFQRSEEHTGAEAEEDEEAWVQTRMVVRLKFSCRGSDEVQRILANEPTDGETQAVTPGPSGADAFGEAPVILAETPVIPETPRASPKVVDVDTLDISTPESTTPYTRAPDTDRPLRSIAPFERQWFDETQNFNMKEVVATSRAPGSEHLPLSDFFNWFPEAVPVDAIFPPGVPLSAKEIMAFYPHHIRWKGVTLRLVNNSYFGETITAMQAFFRDKDKHPLTITNVNQFFRDALKTDLPHFKVSNFQGKPDRNLYTDHLKPLKLLNGTRHGFVVPTFNDLLRGLVYLPAGLDARGLTQCLSWYLNVRDTFTPRLELNALHTQSLIRALRMPLKTYGPQNLDKRALQEWKDAGQFAKRRLEDEAKHSDTESIDRSHEQLKRSRVTIDPEAETLHVGVVVKLRHVLTFPYLAIGGMMCTALEMGIEKAEARSAAREAHEGSQGSEEPQTGVAAEEKEVEDTTEKSVQEKEGSAETILPDEAGPRYDDKMPNIISPSMPAGYKIPKRKRPVVEEATTEYESSQRASPAPGVPGAPLGPRAMSIPERRHAIAPRPLTSTAPWGPSRGALPFSGPTTAPASQFSDRRSHAPDQYHSTPYSSTFSGHHRPSPYASTFSDHHRLPPYSSTFSDHHRPSPYSSTFPHLAQRSHHGYRDASGRSAVDGPQHHFDDRARFPPRNARYSSAFQPESTAHNASSWSEYSSRREH
ncbi:uncharacterized protein N0V89_005211 [Didymosphaeria variabile]|uniref:Uncharacterized protein n=1 Tax=Didymosphaeria variabile TaxID=1932322 RepID=A0A9W9CA91_9PLEO|nr:uncharacterized protein N0V89_005211 [Didymosphaeria variabile]KAJ4353481.1 hypothetical protein N0V89_005211 [Didymosphaeria variabile]